jgi:glycosyltransferase involved in cell wall biosynthesis
MWGRTNDHFIKLIKDARQRKKKVVASFHTIHFQSEETEWGMQKREWELLNQALPLLDFATVFTNGAYNTVTKAFPHHREKLLLLRHGNHIYPPLSRQEARQKLFAYLSKQANIKNNEKTNLGWSFSKDTILLGNYGFITRDKDPLKLYELGRLVQEKLPEYWVITLFIGKIPKRKDKTRESLLPVLESLYSVHDGKENLFFEDYLPERLLPFAFRALDFAIFWCHNATQSGRMAHALSAGVVVAGRRWEGIGETLDYCGLPAAETLDELAEKIVEIVKSPGLKQNIEKAGLSYARKYSYYNQAKKHLLLLESIMKGLKPSLLEVDATDDIYPEETCYRKSGRFKEPWKGDKLHTQCC